MRGMNKHKAENFLFGLMAVERLHAETKAAEGRQDALALIFVAFFKFRHSICHHDTRQLRKDVKGIVVGPNVRCEDG